MDRRFVGKAALVTGTASGIGRAVAQRLAAEGAHVACCDMNEAGIADTVASIKAAGGEAFGLRCDVSNPADAKETVAAAVATLGKLDVLCNIAGIGKFAKSEEQPTEEFDKILAVNLNGSFYMSQAALPHLLESKGNIVNTASTAAYLGQPWSAAYCASKGGVVMLTKAMAWEFVDRGVRINAVAPGGVETNIYGSFIPPEGVNLSLMAKLVSPLGATKPETMANVFAFVASDEASYMTGSIVTMDGGITS